MWYRIKDYIKKALKWYAIIIDVMLALLVIIFFVLPFSVVWIAVFWYYGLKKIALLIAIVTYPISALFFED